jgi:quercetin dioxygenase-like cupin family protein
MERVDMVRKISKPTIIKAAGNKPKQIEEYIGRVNTKTEEMSMARMVSPQGWVEPGQKPEFDEYTVVLKGTLKLKLEDKELEIEAGQAVIVEKNEQVQYSTPYEGGAEYIAICLPAFSPELVHRDL